MKLFDDFDAVKFPEENLIFITCGEYLYYIYNPKYDSWKKHKNAGNDHITVSNYPDVSEEELTRALNGVFPKKETDIMRHCHPSQLNVWNLLNLLKDDYSNYLSDDEIYDIVDKFLSESNIPYKSYLKLKELFDEMLYLEDFKIYNKSECYKKLSKDFNIDLSASWMIGDSRNDIKAGISAGCKTALLIGEGSSVNIDCDYGQTLTSKSLLTFIESLYRYNKCD